MQDMKILRLVGSRYAKRIILVFAVAMGNSEDAPSRYGGSTPRLINLSGPFDEKNYNQPLSMGYCLGVKSEDISLANAE